MGSHLHKYSLFLILLIEIVFFQSCKKKEEFKLINSIFFNGNNQSVCWLLTENRNEQDSSKKFTLNIVSIPQEKVLARSFVSPQKILNYFQEGELHKLVLKGDRIWCITKDSILETRNIISGEIFENINGIADKFPKLRNFKNQIKSFSLSDQGFYLKDPEGKTHFYEISSSILFSEEQWSFYVDSILKKNKKLNESRNKYSNSHENISFNNSKDTIVISGIMSEKKLKIPINLNELQIEKSNLNKCQIFFQNQILIQDKNSVKFALSINRSTGKIIWTQRADSIFNRLQRSTPKN
jgi:hypothetical protein